VRKLLSWRLSLFPLRRLCAPGDKHSGCFINVVHVRVTNSRVRWLNHSTHAGTALHGLAAKTGQHSRHEHSISDGCAAPSVNYAGLDQRRGMLCCQTASTLRTTQTFQTHSDTPLSLCLGHTTTTPTPFFDRPTVAHTRHGAQWSSQHRRYLHGRDESAS
jgi:hypothetical protein